MSATPKKRTPKPAMMRLSKQDAAFIKIVVALRGLDVWEKPRAMRAALAYLGMGYTLESKP